MKLQLLYPVKPAGVNQPFGVNGAYYQSQGINIIGHNGIDFSAYHGQPVRAAHDGQAYFEVDVDQGEGVVIVTNEQFDYGDGQAYFKSIYWHLCDASKEPQFASPIPHSGNPVPVKAGDIIGYADNTGLSTGDHLHFGLKPMAKTNETPWIWYNVEQKNGYLGAIDPTPYFDGYYAEDAGEVVATMGQEVSILQKIVGLIQGFFNKK